MNSPKIKPITDDQFESLCNIVETTAKGIYKACRELKIDTARFYEYIKEKGDVAHLRYARAKELQCDNMADHMNDIADTAEDANLARLQVDTRKWYLSKIKPKRYGDHQQIEIVSSVNKFIESTIKIISEYLPADKKQEVLNKIQASIDFND